MNEEVAVALEQRLLFGQALLALPGVNRGLEFGQALRVAQGGDVTQIAALDQRADHAAHVLARAGFGELADLDEIRRYRDRALFGADEIEQALAVFLGQLAARDGDDEGKRGQPLLAVRRADDEDVADR